MQNEKVILNPIIVEGPERVGKTQLCARLAKTAFNNRYQATRNLDIHKASLKHVDQDNKLETDLKVSLHDLQGGMDTRFLPNSSSFNVDKDDKAEIYQVNDPTAIVLVFDMAKAETFNTIQMYLSKYQLAYPNTPILVVGNKCQEARMDTIGACKEKFVGENIYFIEADAKYNVMDDLVKQLTEYAIKKITVTDYQYHDYYAEIHESLKQEIVLYETFDALAVQFSLRRDLKQNLECIKKIEKSFAKLCNLYDEEVRKSFAWKESWDDLKTKALCEIYSLLLTQYSDNKYAAFKLLHACCNANFLVDKMSLSDFKGWVTTDTELLLRRWVDDLIKCKPLSLLEKRSGRTKLEKDDRFMAVWHKFFKHHMPPFSEDFARMNEVAIVGEVAQQNGEQAENPFAFIAEMVDSVDFGTTVDSYKTALNTIQKEFYAFYEFITLEELKNEHWKNAWKILKTAILYRLYDYLENNLNVLQDKQALVTVALGRDILIEKMSTFLLKRIAEPESVVLLKKWRHELKHKKGLTVPGDFLKARPGVDKTQVLKYSK